MKNVIPVNIQHQKSYHISITTDYLKAIDQYISNEKTSKRYFIVSHPDLYERYAIAIENKLSKFSMVHKCLIPVGENSKSFAQITTVLTTLLENNCERNDTIIALGGGVIGDLAGFAASICLRGLKLIQIPTTLLAQVDASIGGKTGINHDKGKNLIGTFYQPNHIVIDPQFLISLDKEELRSGFAEVIKYGVICNPELFERLVEHMSRLQLFQINENKELWLTIISQCAQNKVDVVSEDEKESGKRAILNFGHTIGHAIEAYFDYGTYRHGECVAYGMVAACTIAVKMGLLTDNDSSKIIACIESYGLLKPLAVFDNKQIINRLYSDKKVKDGKIRFILPTAIGSVVISEDVTESLIIESLNDLKERVKQLDEKN